MSAESIVAGEYHRDHPFALPEAGDRVVSPLTGTAYEIGVRLDEGAHGVVFHCTDEWENALVAKVLRPNPDADFVEIERKAISEIAAQALARSPHIVHIHDAFIFKGACLIISERCRATVRSLIADTAANRVVWFPSLARSVLHALHFIHVHDIAHCDIHSGNVFLHVTPDALLPEDQSAFTFKLGDFGQARSIGTLNPNGTFLNCIRPPEAFDPEEYGPLDYRADIYQAGLLFLAFLTGKEPGFSVEQILAGEPRLKAEGLQLPYADVIAKMLRRHVGYRTPTALDAWRELKEHLFVH